MPHKPDFFLIFIISFLLIFGLIILSSTSVVISQKKFGENYYFVKHQLLNGVLIGLTAFFILSKLNYQNFKKIALILMIISIILMLMVLFIGKSYQGAKRWLSFSGFSIQPSEFLKITLIIFIAKWLDSRRKDINEIHSLGALFLILLTPTILLILEPDVSTLAIILANILVMFFYSNINLSKLVLISSTAFIFLVIIAFTASYRLDRLTSFINPNNESQGKSYQINQSLIAIGSGGILGKGFGKSVQKFNFLPEPISDSIFAVLAEELGFAGVALTLTAFLLILKRNVQLVKKIPDYFGQLLLVGLSSLITIQAIVNILSVAGLIPFMGSPLPFFSYGGSNLLATLIAAGIMVNISKYTK